MAYGFKVVSGTSGLIQQVSSDEPAGVLVDQFYCGYGGTVNRSYASDLGFTQLFAQVTLDGGAPAQGSIAVSISGLNVSISVGYAGSDWGTYGARCIIMGK